MMVFVERHFAISDVDVPFDENIMFRHCSDINKFIVVDLCLVAQQSVGGTIS